MIFRAGEKAARNADFFNSLLEPFVLPRVFARLAERDPVALMTRVQRLHRVLLGVSLLVVLGAVAGSHGGWMF